MGYVMQDYNDSGEYHMYKAHYDSAGRIILDSKIPLCGNSNVNYNSKYKLTFNEIKEENEMALLCANQKTSVRHKICANCVGRFYKTY